MNEQIQTIIAELRDRYAPTAAPPCRICGGELSLERAGGGNPSVWRCAGRVEGGYAPGRKIADQHYKDSEWTDYRAGGDQRVIDICDALERSRFALEWWAADRAIGVEALREAWAVMDSMARAAGVVGAFLEQAAPLLRPDASGNVKAPNYVTATFTDGVQSYEVTIRREGGKTPADIIGEIAARAEAAERRAEEAEAQAAAICKAMDDRGGVHEYYLGDHGWGSWERCPVCEEVQEAAGKSFGRALLDRLRAAEACIAEAETAQKMRAESADPDDETWRTREEYLRRVKAEAERDALRADNARIQSELDALRAIIESGRTPT